MFVYFVQFTGGGTPLRIAIEKVLASSHTYSKQRPQSKQIMILLTDGHTNVDQDPSGPIRALSRRSKYLQIDDYQHFSRLYIIKFLNLKYLHTGVVTVVNENNYPLIMYLKNKFHNVF